MTTKAATAAMAMKKITILTARNNQPSFLLSSDMLHCHKSGAENLPMYSFNIHKLAEIQVVDSRDKPEISSCGAAGQIIIIFVQ